MQNLIFFLVLKIVKKVYNTNICQKLIIQKISFLNKRFKFSIIIIDTISVRMNKNQQRRYSESSQNKASSQPKLRNKQPELQIIKKGSFDSPDDIQQNGQNQYILNDKHYLKNLFSIYKKRSFLPSYQVKYEIGNILSKLVEQKQKVIYEYKQQSLLQSVINEQQLKIYQSKKDLFNTNKYFIQIVNKIKQIFSFIQKQINSSLHSANYQLHSDKKTNGKQQFYIELLQFSKLIKKIQQLSILINQHSDHIPTHSNYKLTQQQINKFSNQTYKKIYLSVVNSKNKTIKQQSTSKLKQILQKYNWPLKRGANRTEKQQKQLALKIQQQDLYFIQSLLHRQSFQYALSNYLITLTNDQKSFKYNSVFFIIFYNKLNQAIQYLFIHQNQSHSYLQPNWMFDYIQQTFVLNYNLCKETLLINLQEQNQGNILIYVLQYSLQYLFYENIKNRLQVDLSNLINKNDSKQNVDEYFYYNFLDKLYELDEKLSITFSQEISLLQNILVEFQINRKLAILEKNFNYEHKWIQQKIFKDFWNNINYSKIDLKNIQAYNIVVNFNVLFQKLYGKFSKIYNVTLVKKINKFYQDTVRNLAAHIKTSFQRIFNHSGLDKLSIILSFKRVDNQFKAGLSGFINKDLSFQKQIKQEYYDYILTFFNVYALQELGIHHRKLLKATTECEKYFTQQKISDQQVRLIQQKSNKIYENWHKKLQQLNKVYNYKDNKIKNQFFTFLESIDFTQKGIMIFLNYYQCFLRQIYSFEGFNIIKMIILMDKKQQIQYLKVNNSIINFLLQSQISAIKKLKIR